MNLGLHQLRYFLAIGDAGVMSKAAQRLNVAQSALSHHVAELEGKLRVQLIERHARGVTLTAAGQRLHSHARNILRDIAIAEQDVRSCSPDVAGSVTIGMAHTVMDLTSLELMVAVREQHRHIMLGLVEGLSFPLTDHLLSGGLDLAVVYNPPDDLRLRTTPLLEEDLYLIGRPDLMEEREDPIAFGDLNRFELVLSHPSAASRALVEDAILRNKLPNHIMELASLTAMTRAVVNGIGCLILGTSTIRAALESRLVIGRRIVDPGLKRTLHIVSLSDASKTRARERIEAIIVQVISSRVVSGQWRARLLIPE